MGEHDTSGPAVAEGAGDAETTETRFGEYVIQGRLGAGGMGAVYLARRDSDGLIVALKVLNPVAGADEGLVKRFIREAQCLLTLDHFNIVKAFDFGSVNGQHFISMEYVPGENLGAVIGREGRVRPMKALAIMRQIADALSYGWELGVVHRDLKPENILVSPDGTCKLADLGLAVLANREDLRLTAPGTIMGTPHYMSPEQARGEHDIDTRSDVYSLGCTIYHAVCGGPPFEGSNAIAIIQKQLSEAPRPPSKMTPDISPGAEQILLKCMEKEPADRFQSCAELVEAIDLELAAADASEPAAVPNGRESTSRRAEFDEDTSGSTPDTEAPGSSDTSASLDKSDAMAALVAHAREPARAPSVSAVPVLGSEPTFSGPDVRRHAAAGNVTPGPTDDRPTRPTIHMPGRRRSRMPMVLLAVFAGGAVLALLSAMLYLFFTTSK